MEIPAELAAADGEALLTAIEILTHRIHVGEGRGKSRRPMTEAEVDVLRAQRKLVRDEVLHRMGEAR
jgi:uncharacterized protein YdcH (DUF465 family)